MAKSTLKSRIPQIASQASLATQKAVHLAGEEVEFEARSRARKDMGDMAAGIEWKPAKSGMSGRVVGKDFKTRWHEYGTVNMPAQPMLVPAAEQARAAFLSDMRRVYR